jgi:hypothetical protein
MSDETLRWITGCGGPLILLPEQLVESWSGLDPPVGGRVVESEGRWDPSGPATDYDRACDVDEAIANIDVGEGRGVVIGGEPAATAFLPTPTGGLLVRWVRAESEQEILHHLEGRSFETESDAVAMIEAHPGPLALFDAACPGGEIEDDKLVVDLHPGQYIVTAIGFEPDEQTSLMLVQLERVG